jgi:dienelactone hydrolase
LNREKSYGNPTETVLMTIQTKPLTYSAGDINMVGYLAEDADASSPQPGVLVLPEWWGLDSYIRRRTDEIAKLGYTALGVDIYGEGTTADHPDQAGSLMTAILEDMETGTQRLRAAVAALAEVPNVDPSRLAAIGFCFGGAMALHLARIGTNIKAAVSFHGALESFHQAVPGEITAKVLVCHGEADEFISQESIEAFHQEMKAANADYEFISYPGALHGFTSPEADENGQKYGLPLAYDENADKESWRAMNRLFTELFDR